METERKREELEALLEPFMEMEGALLPALHKLQDTYGYVDREMHEAIERKLGINTAAAASVQSFYRFFNRKPAGKYVIRLCDSAPCHMKRSDVLLKAFEDALQISVGETTPDGRFTLLTAGCIGACDRAPAALINDRIYGPLKPEEVQELLKGLDHCPDDERTAALETYLADGGYRGLQKAVLKPEEIIPELTAAGLRGLSGSGFPTGTKWLTTSKEDADRKYIVCNADEGEPGTMKDRSILEQCPHAVIEGMGIAAAATGAQKGFIYLRREYGYLIPALKKAMEEAGQAGFLGKDICGSGNSFEIELRLGAGAYICGEETALLESMEGRRGTPRLKPPFPGVKGLWQKPTVINNVETLAAVPAIIRNGAKAYRSCGTQKCPGKKRISLSGNIERPGVYEIPIGTRVRDIYENYGGGSLNGKKLMAVQTGGQSGTVMTPDFLDVKFDPESCREAGGFFGTGDLLFITEDVDLLELLENMTGFFVEESCGKCIPCRVGLVHVKTLLGKLARGEGGPDDLTGLEQLADQIRQTARCAFGSAAVTPVLSALANFRPVFEQAAVKGGF